MGTGSSRWPIKIGLLLVALSWFLYTLWEYIFSTLYRSPQTAGFWILFTEQATLIGLAFRLVASFTAVAVSLFYILKKNLSHPEALMSLRWIIVGEAVYFLSFLPSMLLSFAWGIELGFLIENGIPCLVESILIPIALVKLFFALNPKKSLKEPIKWGLISGTAYVFVFWINNMGNWVYAVMIKGAEYLVDYPVNLLSFTLTTVGLLLLSLYAAYFSKKAIGKEQLTDIDFRQVGLIVTLTGLYFATIYWMWILFGSVGGWGAWYQWFLGHNMDLWVMCLPLVGVPLLFIRSKSETNLANKR